MEREIVLPVDYPPYTPFRILVMEPTQDVTLFKYEGQWTNQEEEKVITLDLSKPLEGGVKHFLILISDFNPTHNREYYYRYENGKFVKE